MPSTPHRLCAPGFVVACVLSTSLASGQAVGEPSTLPATHSSAETAVAPPPPLFLPLNPIRASLGMTFGAAWLDPTAASAHRIGSVGPTFYVTFGLSILE